MGLQERGQGLGLVPAGIVHDDEGREPRPAAGRTERGQEGLEGLGGKAPRRLEQEAAGREHHGRRATGVLPRRGGGERRRHPTRDPHPGQAPPLLEVHLIFGPPVHGGIGGAWARTRFRDVYAGGGPPGGLASALYLDYKTYLPDDTLALSDRISMAHSLEVRVPFVDHALLGAIFPLPATLKIGLWQKNRLVKRALKSRLPEAHFLTPKCGRWSRTSWLASGCAVWTSSTRR